MKTTHRDLAILSANSYRAKSFSVGECEGIISIKEHVQIVAFRGTESGALFEGANWKDVVRDMRIMPWYDEDTGWVHAGFLKGARKAADYLENFLDPNLPIILTGHSLGGALSLLCAVKLQAKGFTIKEWVGFGSPQTQLTKKKFQFAQTNYRNRSDVVPLMPRYVIHRILSYGAKFSSNPWLRLAVKFLPKIQLYRHNYHVITLNPDSDIPANWDDHAIELYVDSVE